MKKYFLVFSVCIFLALGMSYPAPVASAQVPTLTQTSIGSTYTITPTIDPYFGECPIYPDEFDFSALPFDYVARCSHCFPEDYLTLTPAPTSIFPTVIIPTVIIDENILTEYPTATGTPDEMFTPTATVSPTASSTPAVVHDIQCQGFQAGITCTEPEEGHLHYDISTVWTDWYAIVEWSFASPPAVPTSVYVVVDLILNATPICAIPCAGIQWERGSMGGSHHYTSGYIGVEVLSTVDFYLEHQDSFEYVVNSDGFVGYFVRGWNYNLVDMVISGTVDVYSYPPPVVSTPTPTVTPVIGFCSDIPELSEYDPIVSTDGLVTVTIGECIELVPEISFEIPAVEPIWSGWEVDFEGVTVCPYYVAVNSMRIGDVSIPDGMMAIGLGFLLYKLIF